VSGESRGPCRRSKAASTLKSGTTDNPKLKEFLETNLNRKFVKWPVSSGDFFMLTLAALNYHPQFDVAMANHMSTDTK
jgi:hypothetical protein